MLKPIKQSVIYLLFSILGISILLLYLRRFHNIHPATLEIIGITSNIWSISLIRKQNIIGWIGGIISTLSIGSFSIINQVYGQAFLQLGFFLPTNLYAAYTWSKGIVQNNQPQWLTNKQRLITLAWFTTALVLAYFTIKTPNPTVHFFDTIALSLALTGQILMILKKKECWLVFIPSNISVMIAFFIVGGYLLAALNLFFIINAAIAFHQWLKIKDPIIKKIAYYK